MHSDDQMPCLENRCLFIQITNQNEPEQKPEGNTYRTLFF